MRSFTHRITQAICEFLLLVTSDVKAGKAAPGKIEMLRQNEMFVWTNVWTILFFSFLLKNVFVPCHPNYFTLNTALPSKV